MASDSPELELRLTPHGMVAPLEGGATDRGCREVIARFADHEAAGLVSLAAATLPPGVHASALFWRDIAAEFLRVGGDRQLKAGITVCWE